MSSPQTLPWNQLARTAAGRPEETAESRPRQQLLCFSLAGDPYAMRVDAVREIVRMRKVARIPRMPEAVCGVISLRGDIIQVIDLRRRLDLEAAEPGRGTRIIVVQVSEGRAAGLLVDAVTEVLRVAEADLLGPGSSETAFVESLCKSGDRFVSLVNLERILELDGNG